MRLTKDQQAAKRIGRKGGKARAAKLTREERQAIGRHAVAVRWAKTRAREAAWDRGEREGK